MYGAAKVREQPKDEMAEGGTGNRRLRPLYLTEGGVGRQFSMRYCQSVSRAVGQLTAAWMARSTDSRLNNPLGGDGCAVNA